MSGEQDLDPPSGMRGRVFCTENNRPFTFVLNTLSKCSSVIWPSGANSPPPVDNPAAEGMGSEVAHVIEDGAVDIAGRPAPNWAGTAGATGTRTLADATSARDIGYVGIMKDMNRKHLLLLGPPSVAVAVMLSALALLWSPHPGVTKANFDRIEEGMTNAEVEQLLGGTGLPFHGFAHHEPPRTFVWEGDDGSVVFVEFTDNSVMSKKWEPSTESITDRLRRWLHLPK